MPSHRLLKPLPNPFAPKGKRAVRALGDPPQVNADTYNAWTSPPSSVHVLLAVTGAGGALYGKAIPGAWSLATGVTGAKTSFPQIGGIYTPGEALPNNIWQVFPNWPFQSDPTAPTVYGVVTNQDAVGFNLKAVPPGTDPAAWVKQRLAAGQYVDTSTWWNIQSGVTPGNGDVVLLTNNDITPFVAPGGAVQAGAPAAIGAQAEAPGPNDWGRFNFAAASSSDSGAMEGKKPGVPADAVIYVTFPTPGYPVFVAAYVDPSCVTGYSFWDGNSLSCFLPGSAPWTVAWKNPKPVIRVARISVFAGGLPCPPNSSRDSYGTCACAPGYSQVGPNNSPTMTCVKNVPLSCPPGMRLMNGRCVPISSGNGDARIGGTRNNFGGFLMGGSGFKRK